MNSLLSSVEPAFYTRFNDSSIILNYPDYAQALNYFEYRLKQNPKNLLCHLQRIQFTLLEKNKDDLFSAVSDLFFVLGHMGLSLRKRMLAYSCKLLDQTQLVRLNNSLIHNESIENTNLYSEGSFFKTESPELIQMCSSQVSETEQIEVLSETIDSYIENGQFNEALDSMMIQLEKDPENEALTLELIKLCKTLDYDSEFAAAYEKFSDHLMTSQHWDDAKQYFSHQNQMKVEN